jgi:hypothetical protein
MPGERVRVGDDQGVKHPVNLIILREKRRRASEQREPHDKVNLF